MTQSRLICIVGVISITMVSCCCDKDQSEQSGETRHRKPVKQPPKTELPRVPTGQNALPTGQTTLPVTPFVQEGYSSCWSTSAEMIMYWASQVLPNRLRIHQCQQSQHAVPPSELPAGTQCCVSDKLLPGIPPCDRDGLPDFYYWNFDSKDGAPLQWNEAIQEIAAGRAFAFSRTDLTDGGAGSHMKVVVGYAYDGADQKLVVLNPIFDREAMMQTISWEEYAGKAGVWQNDKNYYGIKAR